MKLFKAISNLFKQKEKPVDISDAAQPSPSEPLLSNTEDEKISVPIEEKNIDLVNDEEPIAPTLQRWDDDYIEERKKAYEENKKKLAPKQPKEKTILGDAKYRTFVSPFQKVYEPKEFDTTPNPNKFWRRFKRNGKIYYKKFYTPT